MRCVCRLDGGGAGDSSVCGESKHSSRLTPFSTVQAPHRLCRSFRRVLPDSVLFTSPNTNPPSRQRQFVGPGPPGTFSFIIIFSFTFFSFFSVCFFLLTFFFFSFLLFLCLFLLFLSLYLSPLLFINFLLLLLEEEPPVSLLPCCCTVSTSTEWIYWFCPRRCGCC